MPQPPLTREKAQEAVDMVNRCIEQGFRTDGLPSAFEEADRRLGESSGTIKKHIKRAKQLYDLEVNKSPPLAPRTPQIIVEERRAKKEASDYRSEIKALEEALLAAEDLRSGVLGLGPPIIAKVGMNPVPKSGKNNRSVILHVSDIQYGEYINGSEVDWVNSYSIDIANARIDRLFGMFVRICSEHGPLPVDIHICLGGDMVSGALHEELAKTDELPELPAAKAVAARLAGNIRMVRDKLDRPVKIYSVPGNHGRLTHKPESKGHVLNNLDTLVAWFLEAALVEDKGVTVAYSESVDAVFNVFKFPFLLSHGDRMGGRGGGHGFIGPIGPISKGHQKLFTDAAQRGIQVYKVLTGHYHTYCETSWGIANSALAGWSQFARDLRLKAEPATQNMLIIHPEHGMISKHPILCGIPSEGKSHDPSYLWRAAA